MGTTPRTILVTGASSGIGAAIAERLAADGHRVFGTGRRTTGSTAEGVEMLPLDVCSDASVTTCVETVLQRAGQIDVLVNNAGYLLSGAIEEISLEQAKAQFETNFFGVARMVQAVLPGMRARCAGKIVNMSSLAGMVPGPEVVARVVSRIVADDNPSLRNHVTREATMFPFLRWLLPAGAFESGLRSGFNLDNEAF